jgi:hypothetical protein
VICAIHGTFTTADIPKIEIYDFIQNDTGRPCFDTNHYELDAGANVAGLYEGLGPDGDALGTPIFECMNAVAGADGRTAFVPANCRLVWEWEPDGTAALVLDDIDAVCPHGMVIHTVGVIGADDALINVTYIPWMLGRNRQKASLKTSALGFERPTVM